MICLFLSYDQSKTKKKLNLTSSWLFGPKSILMSTTINNTFH